MEIRYAIALEDHKAWQGAARAALPRFFMLRCTQSIGGAGLLLCVLWVFTYTEYGWWPTLATVGPALALGYYLWRTSPGLWSKARLEQLNEAGKLNGHLGEHTLKIGSDGIVERNAAGEHLSRWKEIDNVYTTPQHTFFITKTQLAYVLPKHSIVEGNYEQFIEAARGYWRQSTG